jgi:geranylgeranyl diphosphate synthase type II
MIMFELKAYLKQRVAEVDAALDELLPAADTVPPVIHEAMRYSIFSGGKRLRPVLCLAACEVCGGDVNDARDAAVALECLHTYTLIHDDLPAMDNDDLRRGRATSHKVFGEAMAILAGDALLTFAFDVLARSPAGGDSNPCSLVSELASAAGSQGVIGGQVMDMLSEDAADVDADVLRYIHEHKTARLIEASCRMGCMAAGGSDGELQALSEYGRCIGLAFQLVDDVLDVTSDEKTLGKPIGSDTRNGKLTYVAHYGIEETQRQAEKLIERAHSSLDALCHDTLPLRALADYVIARVN